jgi:hypothetical protein
VEVELEDVRFSGIIAGFEVLSYLAEVEETIAD